MVSRKGCCSLASRLITNQDRGAAGIAPKAKGGMDRKIMDVPMPRVKSKKGTMVIYPRIVKRPDGSLKPLQADMVRSIAGLSTKE